MPHHNHTIQVNFQSEVQRASQSQQLSLHAAGRTERPMLGAGATSPPPLNAPGAINPARTLAGNAPEPTGPEAEEPIASMEDTDLEFRKYTYAMDLEDRQQEFIKNSNYVTEVGEVFALNRIMRRELMELQRLVVLNAQHAHQETAQVKGTIHDLLELQREVLAHAAQNVKSAPAPPPDYVGLGHSALATVRELGVAMLQRSQYREPGLPSGRGARAPQLPPAAREDAGPPSAPTPDILDKMVSKLRSTTEADIALAMSSPEKWKALLDELIAKEPKDPGTSPSAEPDPEAETRRK